MTIHVRIHRGVEEQIRSLLDSSRESDNVAAIQLIEIMQEIADEGRLAGKVIEGAPGLPQLWFLDLGSSITAFYSATYRGAIPHEVRLLDVVKTRPLVQLKALIPELRRKASSVQGTDGS